MIRSRYEQETFVIAPANDDPHTYRWVIACVRLKVRNHPNDVKSDSLRHIVQAVAGSGHDLRL
jgi:hypothetical protein